MQTDKPRKQAWLVYDGECPLCTNWCRRARIRDAVGELHLIDARQPGPEMDRITAAGLDIDQGMVLIFDDVMYYGPDAIWMMDVLSTRSGWFNRLNHWFYGSRARARIFYPPSKAVRNLVLKIMGIGYIGNLPKAG